MTSVRVAARYNATRRLDGACEDAPMAATDPDLLETAVALLREAGDLTLGWFRSSSLVIESKGDGSPVTEADKAAERFLREQIVHRFPDDSIVGEEEDDVVGSSGRRWIIDPIDGTMAFTHGVPLYTNLLAVEDAEGPAVGVIHMPGLSETVYAGRGLGCFCNGEPARVSTRDRLAGSYLSSSAFEHWTDGMLGAVRTSGARMRTWGDGFGYALVATGRIEAMCDPSAALWDLGPMPVIMSEAGGRFTDIDGDPSPGNGHGLATNGLLHDEWIERFAGLPRR
jgi:histidinol-phosphatase